MKLRDLLKQLNLIAATPGALDSLVAVDTEARCTKAHLFKVTTAVFDPEMNKAVGEDVTVIHLDI